MKKESKQIRKGVQTELNEDRFYRLRHLCEVDLRAKVEIMAGLAQELVRISLDSLFLAAVVKGNNFFFILGRPCSEQEKRGLMIRVIDLAKSKKADCVVSAYLAWAAFPHPYLRAMQNPLRKESLVILGKDHFNRIVGIQDVIRNEYGIRCGELVFTDSVQTWIDEYPVFD